MIVCFTEHGGQYYVEAIEGSQRLWHEHIHKTMVASWLQQAFATRRLTARQTLLMVVPEMLLVRRFFRLPQAANGRQLRAMAANALLPILTVRPMALAVTSMAGGTALCGCTKSNLADVLAPFGRYQRRLHLIGAADYAAAQVSSLADGYYSMQEAAETTVVAVSKGRIADGRSAYGETSFGLWQELLAAHHELLALPESLHPWPASESAVPAEAALLAAVLTPAAVVRPDFWKDKAFVALLAGCVVLPGLLLIGGLLRPAEVADTEEAVTTAAIERSEYHTLLTQAYAVKSERITLLNQEASENALALSGRCSEALDLADYMRQLSAVEPSLHPLLLEMTRTRSEDVSYYDFVVQISLQGGEG